MNEIVEAPEQQLGEQLTEVKPRRVRKTAEAKKPRVPAKRVVGQSAPDQAEFRTWLATLGLEISPALHINGKYFDTVLTVDFGQPLKPVRLTDDQTSELVTRVRKLTRSIVGREINVRVSNDSATGVWWASIN